ncbi:cathepsin L-like [Styela clava]
MKLLIVALVIGLSQCFGENNSLPGGIMELDTNGFPPEFGRAYKKAKIPFIFINADKVTHQVVSGVMYTVDFTAGPAECFKWNGYGRDDDCESKKQKCHLSYVVQAWKKNNLTVVDSKCQFDSDPELIESPFDSNTDRRALNLFNDFITVHGRPYRNNTNDGMYWKRFTVFKKNLAIVDKLNSNKDDKAEYGVTQFMDYTSREYKKYLAPGFIEAVKPEPRLVDVDNVEDVPKSVDWTKQGAVTEVKNQGQCGSCWAFSTTGNVEGQWFLKTGKLISLSEQELVDCDKTDLGCNGGLPANAYKSIEELGGLEKEKDYPYDARGEKCSFDKSEVAVYINDSVTLPTDEGKLASWLYKNGPISIGINAMAMQFYMGGVSHPWKFLCSPKNLDHGVLITGYGETDDGEPYWIIKNSWGPNWGEKGYYRIYRGDGSCGVNKMPTSAIVK